MNSSHRPSVPRLAIAAAAFSALLGLALPSAAAAPTTDDQGFVDSTARCTPPDTAVAFGSTATSRVAVCTSTSGAFEYRGVRVRDGARLILPATSSGTGTFVAENDGITYTLTSKSLTVSAGSEVIREEPMIEYHGSGASSTTPPTSIPSAKPDTPTPSTPLPPPLPAEVGHR